MKKLLNLYINIYWNLEVNFKLFFDYSEKYKYVIMNIEEGNMYLKNIWN